MDTKTNTAELFLDTSATEEIASANVNFSVFPSDAIVMSKTVDRASGFYLSGDPITFTITISNESSNPVNGLFFRDVIDASVIPETGTNYDVTTTSGIITSYDSPVTVSDINIPANGNVVITISGVIA
ncbi:MAG: hypothetical protein IKJ30_03550 [Bacilli bacterium]|nr:hypothetical protein [Bacilli bacterium]